MDSYGQFERLTIQFLGVRGSIPTPAESCLKAGGNTPCLLINYGNEPPVIIDAGTGLRNLGQKLKPHAEKPFFATLLLSHFHWDHIQGFPFFSPLYSSHAQLRLVSGLSASEMKNNLERQMSGPHFPFPFDRISARCSYEQLDNDGTAVGSLRVTPIELNHPGNATGFRIDSPRGSLVYICDHEHGNAAVDKQIVRRSEGADLMIYDTHFTPQEYESHAGWGHSTWREGAQMAQAAGGCRFALFHHSPSRTDEELALLLQRCRDVFGNSFAASEHETVTISATARF